MTLVEIIERKTDFYLKETKQTLSREKVTKRGESFHVPYPRETFNLDLQTLKRVARKKGISSHTYNAYTERLDDSSHPIQAQIQLYLIPKEMARAEEKRIDEIGLDALWEAAGYT